MEMCERSTHQQWFAWFTVGNRLSRGVVFMTFEADDIATAWENTLARFGRVDQALCKQHTLVTSLFAILPVV